MSPHSAPRVLVLRTSRFVGLAVAMAQARWPGADIRVLHQAGTEAELRAAGVEPDPRLTMPRGRRITAASVLASPWGRFARSWHPDHVVVQWWNRDGRGHEAVDLAALLLQPRGFHVVFDDGVVWDEPRSARLGRPFRQAWYVVRGVLIVVAIAAATACVWPAAAWFECRERRRLAARV